MRKISKCGGFYVDGVTLDFVGHTVVKVGTIDQDIKNVINPVDVCGTGIFVDGTDFKVVNDIVTDKNADSVNVSNVINVCGELKLDRNYFSETMGVISLK